MGIGPETSEEITLSIVAEINLHWQNMQVASYEQNNHLFMIVRRKYKMYHYIVFTSIIMANHKKIGIIILAAGNFSRLGSPKQLLTYNGKTLLQHSLQVALIQSLDPLLLY